VLAYLSVDQGHQLRLIELQDVQNVLRLLQVGLQVPHHLPCEFVEQLRMFVVVDVVLVDQTANNVVLTVRFP
jgi:hypothetical protein